MLHAEVTLGLKASAWSSAVKAINAQFGNNDLQLIISSMAQSCNGQKYDRCLRSLSVLNHGGNQHSKNPTWFTPGRRCHARTLPCHVFLSAWYHSNTLAGQALNMRAPLSGTQILAPETGLELATESGPHGAVTHSA